MRVSPDSLPLFVWESGSARLSSARLHYHSADNQYPLLCKSSSSDGTSKLIVSRSQTLARSESGYTSKLTPHISNAYQFYASMHWLHSVLGRRLAWMRRRDFRYFHAWELAMLRLHYYTDCTTYTYTPVWLRQTGVYVYVFSPCASSAYNKSSGRKTRTGSRRQGDRILASPMVLLYETPELNLRPVNVRNM